MAGFWDSVTSLVNALANQRTATAENVVGVQRLTDDTLRRLYRTGLGNKIIRLKAGPALDATLQFASTEDGVLYDSRLAHPVKQATAWMLAFGRGLIVVHHRGDDLGKPRTGPIDPARCIISVFSGDLVTVGDVDRDLQSPTYNRPNVYNVRGVPIHASHCVDFTYIRPPEVDAPIYCYGGLSEFDLVYDQIIADGVVQRASPRIIEKASTLFYKVKGFKALAMLKKDQDLVNYFGRMEDLRGIWSAGITDAEDDVVVVNQQLSNLADADQITLRRLAMVTGIPLSVLVGESVRGLNATGENEMTIYRGMIESLQSEYLLHPINRLMALLGQGVVEFKDNQGETAETRITYDSKAIDNAHKLWQMGEDHRSYLERRGVLERDAYESFFTDSWSESDVDRDKSGQFAKQSGGGGAATGRGTSTGKTQIASGDTLSENLQAAEKEGFNTDNVFVHRTGSHRREITEIKSSGNFPGLFALESDDADQASTYGPVEYRFVIKGEPWSSSELSDAMESDTEGVNEVLSEVTDDEDIQDQLREIIVEEDYPDDEDLYELFGSTDYADLYKELQSLRIKLATKLGAPAVSMHDEFSGDSVALLPGDGVMMVSKPGVDVDE